MSYQNSAACKIVATNCCCCGKPLVDAKSVETGMGPVCRKKYGFDLDVPERVRALANRTIYRLACDVSQGTVTLASMEAASGLRAIGFVKIADIFQRRLVKISVHVADWDFGGGYYVRTPYDPTGNFNSDAWAQGRKAVKIPAPFAPTKRKVFHWVYPKTEATRKVIHNALVKHYKGELAFAPDGSVFQIGAKKSAKNAA